MPSINLKIHFVISWIEHCNLTSAGSSVKLKRTDAKLHVPIVTLSTKDNVNLTKQLSNGVLDLKDLFIGRIIKLFLEK